MVLAVDDRQSFETVQEIYEFCICIGDKKPKTVLLVANKCDVLSTENGVVQLREGLDLAQRLECEFCPISTKNHDEVWDVWNRFGNLLNAAHQSK